MIMHKILRNWWMDGDMIFKLGRNVVPETATHWELSVQVNFFLDGLHDMYCNLKSRAWCFTEIRHKMHHSWCFCLYSVQTHKFHLVRGYAHKVNTFEPISVWLVTWDSYCNRKLIFCIRLRGLCMRNVTWDSMSISCVMLIHESCHYQMIGCPHYF